MEHERTRLEGTCRARCCGYRAGAESSIDEMNIQIQNQLKISGGGCPACLTRQKIADLRERLSVSQDVVNRLAIAAPRAGMVQTSGVFTIGCSPRG